MPKWLSASTLFLGLLTVGFQVSANTSNYVCRWVQGSPHLMAADDRDVCPSGDSFVRTMEVRTGVRICIGQAICLDTQTGLEVSADLFCHAPATGLCPDIADCAADKTFFSLSDAVGSAPTPQRNRNQGGTQ